MKKMLKLSLFFALVVLFITPCFASGLTFSKETYYSMDDPFSVLPSTFEATVLFPSDLKASDRGGVIVGNYDGSNACLNFEVYTNGVPRLYIRDENKVVYDIKFTDINIYTGVSTHVAIVKDTENSVVHCYIDGQLKQTVEAETPAAVPFITSMNIGGDKRSGNSMYCKGTIFDVAIYDDVRSEEEILSDYTNGNENTSGLLAYYDLSEYSDTDAPSELPDLSGNGNNCSLSQSWITDMELPENFSYSFAIVGDTQILTLNYPQYLTNIYDWIVDNADENKLKFVFGLGDITHTNTNAEWALAKAVIQKLDGVVPYSLVRGNHDKAAEYTQFLPYSEYKSRLSGSYDGTMLNTYQFLTVNGIKYLIFGLDYGASDEILNWAGSIIEQNSDCNVIITTHAYLYRDGTTLDAGDVCPPSTSGGYNDGDHMWDKLIKKHENIVLVISGHDPCDNIILAQDEGENGNIVSQMLVDPQGTDSTLKGCGLVAMLYFSEDGKKVDVRYYSTVENKYFMSKNQFSFDINVIEPDSAAPVAPSTEIRGISFNVALTANEYTGKIIAALYDEFGNMTSVQTYDAAKDVAVSFPESAGGSQVKVFWWNGLDTIVPVCTQTVLNITD